MKNLLKVPATLTETGADVALICPYCGIISYISIEKFPNNELEFECECGGLSLQYREIN